jgi:glycosyltransferase involved in cell wall biosynthesis
MWRIKRLVMQRASVTLVVAGGYMAQLVSESPILRHLPCKVIPFGVANAIFKPGDRAQARANLGIPQDADVISLRFRGPRDPHKGSQLQLEALRLFRPKRHTVLVVFDRKNGLEELAANYQIQHLGWVDEPARLADGLRSSDVFVMPSTAEAFGLMAVEAMACGTPVVVCDGTALPATIMAPRGGISVPADPASLARAIESLLSSPDQRRQIGEQAAQIAQEHYSEEVYIDRHLEFYRELTEAQP